jgi:hypothetical protein
MQRANDLGLDCGQRVPYTALRCYVLCSPAFLDMTADDAATILQIEPQSVRANMSRLYETYPHLSTFDGLYRASGLGSVHQPLQLTDNMDTEYSLSAEQEYCGE